MERNILRIAGLMIIFVVLVPAVSMAGNQFVSGTERPIKSVVSRSEGDALGVARLLAFLRQVFGELADVGAGADGYRQKDLENRMGIDPNGNS
jgi:hypothetical protein